MLTGLVQRIDQAKFLLKDHAPTILTGVGVTGTVVTAYLTGRASFKAAEIIATEQSDLEKELKFPDTHVTISKTDKVKLTWKLYIPPVGAGVTTIASIIMANKITSKRIAALGIAAGISERALQEYKEKVMEKLSDRQHQNVYDEKAQDRISKHPTGSNEVILAGTGQVLCYDMTTGRYFQSTKEDIQRAENKINSELLHHMSASLAEFHDLIGLPATSYTDSVGWSGDEMFEVIFSSALTPDSKPCLAIDFKHPPVLEYSRTFR